MLHRIADIIEERALELTVLGVRDNGTEFNMAIKAEAGSAAGTFRYYAEALDKVYGEVAPIMCWGWCIASRWVWWARSCRGISR